MLAFNIFYDIGWFLNAATTYLTTPSCPTPDPLDMGQNEASTSQSAKRDQRKGSNLIIRRKGPVKPTPSAASEFEADDVLEDIRNGKQRIISFKGSSQYGDKLGTRVSASTCGLAALNFARIAFKLEKEQGMQGLELLTELLSHKTNEEITSICDYWKSDLRLEIEELLKVPIFNNYLELQTCTYSNVSEQRFHDLLQDMVDPLGTSPDCSVVAVITRPPEIVACLKIRVADKDVFVIFDSHPRPSHPDGQGFIVNPSIEGAAAYLSDLLAFDKNILDDPSLQWEAQLLGHFSGHILQPLEEEPSTTEVLLESSMALLSAYADVAREKSRSSELQQKVEELERQQKVEELERQQRFMEERVRYLEQCRREDYDRHREANRSNARRTRYDRNNDKTIPSESHRDSSSRPNWQSSNYRSTEDDGAAPGWQSVNLSGKKDKGKGRLDQVLRLPLLGTWVRSTSSSRRDRPFPPIDRPWEQPPDTSMPGGFSGPPVVSEPDRYVAIAVELQRLGVEIQQLRAQKQVLQRRAPAVFRCRICMDDQLEDSVARIEKCRHAFCRDCLRDYTTSKISERRFPIVCPVCSTEKERPEHGLVDEFVIQQIGLSDNDYRIFEELQLTSFCVPVHCRRCEQTMFIDREEHQEAKEIVCPWPTCLYVWCKACQQPIEADGPKHSCDGSNELQHLMQQQGWKLCPGCQTPVQKSEGCNHMSCITPSCNSHFCYVDGVMISKGGTPEQVQRAKQTHYANCKLFEYD